MVIVEAVTRLLPGVLGDPDSAADDPFAGELADLVEAPSYTRPPVYRGLAYGRALTRRRRRGGGRLPSRKNRGAALPRTAPTC